MPENKTLDLYNARANILIEHYDALTKIVRETLFPWKFVASSTLPDSKNWSEGKRKLMIFMMPLSFFDFAFDNKYHLKLYSFLLWMFIYVLYYGSGVATLIVVSEMIKVTGSTSAPAPSMRVYIARLIVIIFVVVALLVYGQVMWYLFHRKTSWRSRLIWIGSFLFIAYTAYIQIVDTVPNLFFILSSNHSARTVLLFSIIVFWIPTVIMTASLLLILGKLLAYVMFAMLTYLVQANSPNYSFLVKTILLKSLDTSNTGSIFDLPTSEIVALKAWAERNLDTTEKRTIPAIILLAILGATVTFSSVQSIFYDSLINFINLFSKVLNNFLKSPQGFMTYLATFMVATITLFIILSIIFIYIRLLSNLFVQGVLIEVCTVAEYAKVEIDKEIEKRNKEGHRARPFRFLGWLLAKLSQLVGQ